MEVWLGDLLAGVRQTLHTIIRQAYVSISDPGLKLLDFQAAFPAQVGLLGIQMIWTRNAEAALVLSKSDKKVCLVSLKVKRKCMQVWCITSTLSSDWLSGDAENQPEVPGPSQRADRHDD